jgi:8-oxo-dGTP pyrophosphatase MutT (NUDIX family)
MKVHSGQIAFPGGKWETEDENFSVTAAETHEEVGIHPDKMEIIKFLRLPISSSNFMVHPFLESVRRFALYLILLKFPVLNYHYPSFER